jgi:hypothetical protein
MAAEAGIVRVCGGGGVVDDGRSVYVDEERVEAGIARDRAALEPGVQ